MFVTYPPHTIQQPTAKERNILWPNNCTRSFVTGVSWQPAQAAENSSIGVRN